MNIHQTQHKHFIYIAQDPNKDLEGFYKVGETDRIETRIKGLNVTRAVKIAGSIQYKIIFDLSEATNPKGDKAIIKYLTQDLGYQNSNQYIKCELNTLIKIVSDFLGMKDQSNKIVLRQRQIECVNKILKSFEFCDESLINAVPRFGKTVTCFTIANEFLKATNKKYVFYISVRTDTFSPVRQDYLKYHQNWNYSLIQQDNGNRLFSYKNINTDNILICCSKQYLQKCSTLQQIANKFGIENLKSEDIALFIFDQAHIAYDTESTQKIKNILNPFRTLYVTGTATHLLCDQKYNFDQNNTYSYGLIEQEQDIKKGIISRENHPKLQWYIPVSPVINCDWQSFFCGQNKNLICKWLTSVLAPNGDFYLDKQNNTKIPYKLFNLIFVTPKKRRYCKLIHKCLSQLNTDINSPLYNKINVFMACDQNADVDGNRATNCRIYSQYNKSCYENKDKYNILVTLGKGTLCLSYPQTTGIIMCDNCESFDQYMQSICRVKTPNKSRTKTASAIIDFNSNRVLRMLNRNTDLSLFYSKRIMSDIKELDAYHVYDSNLKLIVGKVEDLNEAVVSTINLHRFAYQYSDVINYNDLKGIDLSKIKNIFSGAGANYVLTEHKVQHANKLENEDDFFENINSLLERSNQYILNKYGVSPYTTPVCYNSDLGRYQHNGYFNFDTKSFVCNEIIYAKFNPNQHGSVWKFDSNNQHVTLFNENRKEQDDKNCQQHKRNCQLLLNCFSNCLPYFIFDVLQFDYQKCNSIEVLQDLIDNNLDVFCEYLGFKLSKQIVKKIIKSISYRQNVANSKVVERNSLLDKIIKKVICMLDKSIDNNNSFNQNIWNLYDEKFNVSKNIPNEWINENPDLLICGGKNFISEHTKCYITMSKQQKFIVEKLHKHVTVKYCKSFEEIEKTLKQLKKMNMKFNVALTNPPYYRGQDLKILGNILPICNKAIAVHPATWILQNKQSNRFSTFIDKFEKYIKSIDLFWANPIFHIGLFVPCSITVFDMNKKDNEICVKNLDRKVQYSVNTLKDITCYDENYSNLHIKDFFNNIKKICVNNLSNNFSENKKYQFRSATIKGSVGLTKAGINDDFFSIVALDQVGCNINGNKSSSLKWSFDTEEERENFICYLKSKIVRFLLSYYKANAHLDLGEINIIPWMDFTKHWNDKVLKEYFYVSDELWKYIDSFIPNYYDDYKFDM